MGYYVGLDLSLKATRICVVDETGCAVWEGVADSPRRRNHVRLWLIGKPDALGRPVWIGAASYDERVGLSHTTGQITHHIAPDVDVERDHLFASLQQAGTLSDTFKVEGFHKVLRGRNGGGDPWYTDGSLWVGTLAVKRER